MFPRIVSEQPGTFRLDDGRPLLVCPWHGWQYDMATGQAYAPGDPHMRSYEVTVEPGRAIAAELDVAAGRYVAETFPVYVERTMWCSTPRTRVRMTFRRRGGVGECDARMEGVSTAAVLTRPRTKQRAAQHGPTAQAFIPSHNGDD